MMKIQILIGLAAACAPSVVANAQTIPNQSYGVQLRDIPGIGPLFRAPVTPVPFGNSSLFGPGMPPRPKLPAWNDIKLKLSVLKTPKGDVFQLEANGQSRAAILKKITDVMGVRAVIDPQLEKKITITQVFRGLSWDDLLASVNYGIEMVKSPSGTYFFADRPVGLAFNTPSNYSSQPDDLVDPTKNFRAGPRFDPFVYPYGGLPAPDLKGWGVPPVPQPHWEKREFNGHEFYYVPSPTK